MLDGNPVDVFSGEGIILEKPVTREDYEELAAGDPRRVPGDRRHRVL